MPVPDLGACRVALADLWVDKDSWVLLEASWEEAAASEVLLSEVKDSEIKDLEVKVSEVKDLGTKDLEVKALEVRDSEVKALGVRDSVETLTLQLISDLKSKVLRICWLYLRLNRILSLLMQRKTQNIDSKSILETPQVILSF